jgi:D-alanyl-D-alanine carboxypeptidase/D-alanyl-D-alanine-endopeptidase (penicillin-binding protein 4)
MLLRLLGSRVKGQGTTEGGHEAALDFLRRINVPADSWDLRDAAGLSRSDLVTPHGLAALMVAMARHPHAAVFRDSLPVAGVDGTLEGRMKGRPAQGRVQAKTGSLRHVNALAGYATHQTGDRLAFAIMLNHHTAGGPAGVGAIDDIVEVLVTR